MIDFKLLPVDTVVEYYVKGLDKNEAVSIGFFRRVDADPARPFIVSPYPTIVGNKSEIGASKIRVSDKTPWLPWLGGDCPVPPNCMVDVHFRIEGMGDTPSQAREIRWSHNEGRYSSDFDVIAYRLAESPWQTINGVCNE